MALLLGIDLGTSYFKVGLFDERGTLRGLGRVAVPMDSPAPSRSELPVPRFWDLLRRGLADALQQAGANARDIVGVSYSSQANSFVLLDHHDVALTPIVSWTDLRAEPIAADLEAFSRRAEFAERVGFSGWSGGFAVAKWRWLQNNAPDIWTRVRRVQTIADYLSFTLSGETAGDASTAAFLGLLDLQAGRWWSEALAVVPVHSDQLVVPRPPGSAIGTTTTRAADLLGLPSGIPFAVGGLDHHVAALGAGLGSLADVSISTGTVLAAMLLLSSPVARTNCYHGPHFDRTRFFRLSFDGAGAGQLEDYQRRYAPELTLVDLVARAALSPAAATPPRDLATADKGAATRYLLEKVAATHRTLLRDVAVDTKISRIVATGGGARSSLWLQIKADMLGVPVMAPPSVEPACLGAAMLASVAAGLYRHLDEAAEAMITPGAWHEPEPVTAARYHDWVA